MLIKIEALLELAAGTGLFLVLVILGAVNLSTLRDWVL